MTFPQQREESQSVEDSFGVDFYLLNHNAMESKAVNYREIEKLSFYRDLEVKLGLCCEFRGLSFIINNLSGESALFRE